MKEKIQNFFNELYLQLVWIGQQATEDKGQVISASIVLLLTICCFLFTLIGV